VIDDLGKDREHIDTQRAHGENLISVEIEEAVGEIDDHPYAGLRPDDEAERHQGSIAEDQQIAGRIGLDRLDGTE
jgi:hypothetical protein